MWLRGMYECPATTLIWGQGRLESTEYMCLQCKCCISQHRTGWEHSFTLSWHATDVSFACLCVVSTTAFNTSAHFTLWEWVRSLMKPERSNWVDTSEGDSWCAKTGAPNWAIDISCITPETPSNTCQEENLTLFSLPNWLAWIEAAIMDIRTLSLNETGVCSASTDSKSGSPDQSLLSSSSAFDDLHFCPLPVPVL